MDTILRIVNVILAKLYYLNLSSVPDDEEFPSLDFSKLNISSQYYWTTLLVYLLPVIPLVSYHIIIILLWYKIFMMRVISPNELQNDGLLPKSHTFFFFLLTYWNDILPSIS